MFRRSGMSLVQVFAHALSASCSNHMIDFVVCRSLPVYVHFEGVLGRGSAAGCEFF